MDEWRKQLCRLGAIGLWLFSSVVLAEHYTVPLFVASTMPGEAQGVLRVLNGSAASGSVEIYAIDDAGTRSGPAILTLNTLSATELTASELVTGSAMKGLSGGVGALTGDVRLELHTELTIEALAYVLAPDGTLSAVHDTVRGMTGADASTYEVPIFNPASNVTQVSRLRLINPNDEAASVTIGARDDTGAAATGGEVQLTLPRGGARTLTAQQLEAGDASVEGRLGAGVGRWRLTVSADRPIQVVSVTVNASGYWNNLSTSAVRGTAPSGHAAFNSRVTGLTVVYATAAGRFTLAPEAGGPFHRGRGVRWRCRQPLGRLWLHGHRPARGPSDARVRRRSRVPCQFLLHYPDQRLARLPLHRHRLSGGRFVAGRQLVH